MENKKTEALDADEKRLDGEMIYKVGQKYTNPDGLTMTVTYVTDLQICYEFEEKGKKEIGVLDRSIADNWRKEGIMTLPNEDNVSHFELIKPNEELKTVYLVYVSDDDVTHVFSTRQKAEVFSRCCPCSCAVMEYLLDDPTRFYEREQ